MEIVIHGTKLGAKVFTSNKLSGLLDVSPNSPSPSSIGKEAYAIRFVDNYTIFSKYKIIRDVLGDKRTGFVAFSLFVPRNKKNSGINIINLLDEISKEYCKRYIVDNNLGNVEENWDFITQIKDELKPVNDHILSGTGDDAYVYYKKRDDLQRYFDAPFQDDYIPFRQIYFIDEIYNNKLDNPLNALRYNPNANITDKIRLDNLKYKLRDYDKQPTNGISIEIRANGVLRKNNDKIFKEDLITIRYSKKYYKDIDVKGNLLDSNIAEYLKTYENSTDIDVIKNIDFFDPILKPVEIRIKDSKGKPITNAIITFKNNDLPTEKQVHQNTIVFIGPEQSKRWTISAKKDRYFGEKTIIPEQQTSIVELELREVKEIQLQIFDEKSILKESRILKFFDDDIRNKQTEPINIPGYQFKSESFTPINIFNNIKVYLVEQSNKPPIKLSFKGFGYTSNIDEGPPKKRLYFKILIASSIACILVVGAFFLVGKIWHSNNSNDTSQQKTSQIPTFPKLTSTEIVRYVKGDSLFLDKLNKYKEDWANLKNTIDNKNYKKYDEYIDEAINKRKAITEGDFGFLTDSRKCGNYYNEQQTFENEVKKIKKVQFEVVKLNLGNVSKLTLTEIGEEINKILSNMVPPKEAESQSEIMKTQVKGKNENGKNYAREPEKERNNREIEIINYLKGNKLLVSELNRFHYDFGISKEVKKSITLALEFWNLDGEPKTKTTYYTYKSKVQKDPYLKENITLNSFLKNSSEKKYPKETPGAGTTLTLIKFSQQ